MKLNSSCTQNCVRNRTVKLLVYKNRTDCVQNRKIGVHKTMYEVEQLVYKTGQIVYKTGKLVDIKLCTK